MNKVKYSTFTNRIHAVFSAIFAYHFTRKPVMWERKTMFGSYTSMRLNGATKSPLLRLLKEELVGEFASVEILVKHKTNQTIDDTDLESVIMNVRKQEGTLFILVTSGNVPSDDFSRLFRVFTRHIVVILPLGENDISQLETFVKNGNINACLVVLSMLADRIVTDPGEKLYGSYETRAQSQKEANLARLNSLDTLTGPQLRTILKKLRFLMSVEKSGDIAKTCAAIHISRKLFYLWCEKDKTFKKLIHIS